jgi:hypothetical protein
MNRVVGTTFNIYFLFFNVKVDIEHVGIKVDHKYHISVLQVLYIHFDIHQQDMCRVLDDMAGWYSDNFLNSYFQMYPIHMLQNQSVLCILSMIWILMYLKIVKK